MKVCLSRDHLQAALYFVAVKDIRYYLNGVMVEVNGHVRVVATDGHRMFVANQEFDAEDPIATAAPFQIIIPSDAVKDALRMTRKASLSCVILDTDANTLGIDSCVSFKPIDGTFPDYDKAIPRDYDGKVAQFNPACIMDCQRAAEVYSGKRGSVLINVRHNGDRAALVRSSDPSWFAVVMPIRGNDAATLPEWFAPPVAEPESEEEDKIAA